MFSKSSLKVKFRILLFDKFGEVKVYKKIIKEKVKEIIIKLLYF
jgi:hypothetical protein